MILSFQYCLLNTVFSHTVTHPHTPLWLERAPPRRPAPRLSWAGAPTGVQRRWLLLGCCWAAAGCCWLLLCCAALCCLQGCRADDDRYHYHYHYHYHFSALFSNPVFIVIIRGAAARAVHSTESRGDPRPVSAVNLDLWKRGAAACKWRRQVSRGQG